MLMFDPAGRTILSGLNGFAGRYGRDTNAVFSIERGLLTS